MYCDCVAGISRGFLLRPSKQEMFIKKGQTEQSYCSSFYQVLLVIQICHHLAFDVYVALCSEGQMK